MANGTIAFDTLSTSGQISGTAKSLDTDYLAYGSNKAWNNFSLGTSINESFNVSSITDVNTGRYTTTFTNNMDDANFSFAGGANGRSGNVTYDSGVSIGMGTVSGDMVSSSISMQISNESGTSEDCMLVSIMVVR